MSQDLAALQAPADTAISEPPSWNVIVLNDDFTPLVFVVELLMDLFDMDFGKADALAFKTHAEGRGIAGTYTKDIAETKAALGVRRARAHNHPLTLFAEKGN